MPDQAKVTIVEPDGKEYIFWTIKGITVWEALEMVGWDTRGACGGNGTCGKCKFRMTGDVSKITSNEREHLMSDEIRDGQRLACIASVEGDFTLYIDYWQPEIMSKTELLRYRPGDLGSSQISSKGFFIPGHQKELPIPIYDRIKTVLAGYRLDLSPDNINSLSSMDRPGRPAMELHAVVFENDRVKYISKQKEILYGLALDIGSTSLFAALIDMETGLPVAMASQSNMQRIYGDDIISRVNYTLQHEDGVIALQRILVNNLNSMIIEMLDETGSSHLNIYKLTAVGNPVMLHLLLGLSVSGFGTAPYMGVFSDEIEIPAVTLGLNVNPLSKLTILPQIGGFVGADTTACLLSLAPAANQTYLLLDIGTNGEIVLCHHGKSWATSAAAGPAFEGGAISSGMRAGYGAIDSVYLDNGELTYRIIGGGRPRGICGSGILDLISVLLEIGCIDSHGIFTEQVDQLLNTRIGDHGVEIILNTGHGGSDAAPLCFNQDDVRQVQLARSAIRTAIEILLHKARIGPDDLEQIFLAGTFGSYLNPTSIINIGLIPAVDLAKISNIGNAAAQGAIMALLSDKKLQEAVQIANRVKCVELADEEDFQALFLKHLDFK